MEKQPGPLSPLGDVVAFDAVFDRQRGEWDAPASGKIWAGAEPIPGIAIQAGDGELPDVTTMVMMTPRAASAATDGESLWRTLRRSVNTWEESERKRIVDSRWQSGCHAVRARRPRARGGVAVRRGEWSLLVLARWNTTHPLDNAGVTDHREPSNLAGRCEDGRVGTEHSLDSIGRSVASVRSPTTYIRPKGR